MTLVEFLLERIAEEEERARKRITRSQENYAMVRDPKNGLLGRLVPGWHEWPEIEADARQVLAECAAKRRIVQDLRQIEEGTQRAFAPVIVHAQAGWAAGRTLRHLASAHADHPDYRKEWRLA